MEKGEQMSTIGIVVDSTCDLEVSFYEEHDIEMVPLYVRFGDDVYRDWREMPPDRFYPMLTEGQILPKTSQPTPQDFVEVYQRLAGRCERILSIHLSQKLSGTFESATMAAGMVDIPVDIVDTKLVSGGIALVVDRVLARKAAGASAEELAAYARDVSERVRFAAMLQTLEYLEKVDAWGRPKRW